MKFKTTAIAMAVAGTVAAPVAVQAGADEIYASARVGLWWVEKREDTDTGDDDAGQQRSDAAVKSFSSRFGARGETDLGNGLTGFGRYEWDVDEDDFALRHRYVGLKGDFGSIKIGKGYHTFYNFVVGPVDIPWWHAGYAMIDYGAGTGASRADNGITYAGSSDAFAFGVTTYFTSDSEEDSPDVYTVAASYTFGNDMVLAGAAKDTQADLGDGTGTLIGNDNDEAVFGGMLSGIMLGDFGIGIGVQGQDDDLSEAIDVTYSNFYAHFELEQVDSDSPVNNSENATDGNPLTSPDDQDRISTTLGYTQSLGRKTTAYYEINYIDNDTGDSDDDRTAVMAVLKYDII